MMPLDVNDPSVVLNPRPAASLDAMELRFLLVLLERRGLLETEALTFLSSPEIKQLQDAGFVFCFHSLLGQVVAPNLQAFRLIQPNRYSLYSIDQTVQRVYQELFLRFLREQGYHLKTGLEGEVLAEVFPHPGTWKVFCSLRGWSPVVVREVYWKKVPDQLGMLYGYSVGRRLSAQVLQSTLAQQHTRVIKVGLPELTSLASSPPSGF